MMRMEEDYNKNEPAKYVGFVAKYECTECQVVTSDVQTYCRHMSAHKYGLAANDHLESIKPTYSCNYCDYRSNYSSNMYKHVRRMHGKEGTRHFLAQSRGFASITRSEEAQDKSPVWPRGRSAPYTCPNCNAGYTYKKTLMTHLTHDCGREPRFRCPYCGKRDKCSSNIYKHVRIKHGGLPVKVHRN
ncbi:zinc finger protein 547-like [Copidosoma floridanum]|uniref:zinc finger protein 547-like n=1 Tax=Copidosoma floridanum TaxID=29053 RepID=UPI000C6FA33D|nr:zinc finger protein 547-like [Copidosoma floridanum]